MRTRHHHHHRLSVATATAFALLFLASVTSTTTLAREIEEGKQRQKQGQGGKEEEMVERLLLGSAPPTCRSKCGRCTPCKAVHVPVQPGRSMPLEYYPEAWRCKCGNKLFMP